MGYDGTIGKESVIMWRYRWRQVRHIGETLVGWYRKFTRTLRSPTIVFDDLSYSPPLICVELCCVRTESI
jgi:hypothetical protein